MNAMATQDSLPTDPPAEMLRLAHTLGRRGWTAAHEGARSAFALAAVGRALTRPGAFGPALLWRLFRLWRAGLARLDPAALRLALATDARVKLGGLALAFEFSPPAAAPQRIDLPLLPERAAAARLAPLPAPWAWRAFRLAPAAGAAWAGLARAGARLPAGTRLTIEATAMRSAAPLALRAGLPLRVDLRLADGDALTLLAAQHVALEAG